MKKGAASIEEFIAVIVADGFEMKYSPVMHIKRVQTLGVGTRLPAQGCVKTVGGKRVAKWSCETFVPSSFREMSKKRGERLFLHAKRHERKSARAKKSSPRYPLRGSALGKREVVYLFMAQGVF